MDLRLCCRGARLAFWLALAVGLVVSLATLSSRADSASAEELIRDGLALRRAGKDAEALEVFRRAQDVSPSARGLSQIALAEQALGRWADAEEHLKLALLSSDPWVVERRPLLQKALEEVEAQLGTLEVRANRPGAEVLLDGSLAGKVPLQPRRLSIGSYEVVVRAAGFKPVTRTVQIRSRGVTRADFELTPITDPAPPAPAHEHDTFAGDRATRAHPAPEKSPSWQRTAAWIALASAGALLIGSITAHVIRENQMAAYNDDSRCLVGTRSRKERCGDHLQAAQTAQIFAVAGYAATGVELGTSILLFAMDPGRDGGERGTSVPTSHSRVELRLSGSF